MVVPHVDERPSCSRILQVRIMQISTVHRTVVVHRRGNVKVINLLSVLVVHNVAQAAIVHPLWPVLRVPDDLIDEITEMQNKVEPICFRCVLILKDHFPIRVLCPLICILAAHKCKADRSCVSICRSRNGAPDSATKTVAVDKPIPINACRLQSSNQHSTGPIRFSRNWSTCFSNHTLK